MIDFDKLQLTLEKIVEHYSRHCPAPTVANWANDLYIRVSEDIDSIRMVEIMLAGRLWNEKEGFTQANEAANQVFKLKHRLGQDTTGDFGF